MKHTKPGLNRKQRWRLYKHEILNVGNRANKSNGIKRKFKCQ